MSRLASRHNQVGTGLAIVQERLKLQAVSSMELQDLKNFDRLPRRDRR